MMKLLFVHGSDDHLCSFQESSRVFLNNFARTTFDMCEHAVFDTRKKKNHISYDKNILILKKSRVKHESMRKIEGTKNHF